MAKPAPTHEYFEFSCRTVDVASCGPIMAQLAKIEGLLVSPPKLVTDVVTFKQNNRTNHEIKAEDFLRAFIAEHPTFRAREAIKAFRADGRTDGAGYTALRVLAADGTLKKLGEGMYARADVKHLAGPKKAKPKKKVQQAHHAVSNADFILRAARRNHGRFNSLSMKKLFEADGRASSGVGPTINTLRERGLVKALGEGQYELTARAHKKPAAKKKLNGAGVAAPAAVTPTEAAAHG